jgi:protein O-GlcNAc transferase
MSGQIDQLLQSAMAHHQAGRLGEAEQLYRQILAAQPQNADALHLLGLIAQQIGNHDAAIDLISRAIAINANYPAAYSNLGTSLVRKGQLDAAIASWQRAIQLKPDFAEAHNNLGSALSQKAEPEQAIAEYRRAIQIRPDYAEAYSNLGKVLRDRGEIDAAINACRWAIELNPSYAKAFNNLANACRDAARLDEAIAAYRRAIELAPGEHTIGSNLVYLLNFHPRMSAAQVLAETRAWAARYAHPLKSSIRPHENDRDPNRRLRIGCISPDFRGTHCQSFFLLPLFSSLDRNRIEIFCYADVPRPDAVTERLRSLATAWRNIVGINDADVARMVRSDRIDILVDLTMHMMHGRPLVFARKPAPIQVAWLAYPGTTGIDAIDYRLTDPYLDPPGVGDDLYTETSIRLPDTFWCVDRLGNQAIGELPTHANGFVTFGCLNNYCKVNEDVLLLWARVLAQTPNSKLILLSPQGEHRQHALEKLGVDAGRVEFVERQPWPQYMRTYQQIDIGLDTVPYNGHTTTLDSMWMGVPVVTLVGDTAVGRAGLSQLTNIGLTELIARTPDQFVEIAVKLAGDQSRLSEIRRTLRDRMAASPLCGRDRFARAMENAFRQMWQNRCR